MLRPDHPAFQSLSVGMLTAGVLTLVRLELRGQAVMLAVAYGVLQLGMTDEGRWAHGLGGALLGLGLVVVGEIYNELAKYGFRFGKFLIVGPLLGGVLMAVAPIVELTAMIPFDTVRPLLLQLFLGVVIGDGVGLGLEVAEMLPLGRAVPDAEPSNAANPG